MQPSTPIKPPRRYTRFCGIDVAKRKHVACILDRDGAFVTRSQSFNNDAEGFQQILARLHEAGGPGKVAVAMEATGHYGYSLQDFRVGQDYQVAVLNPIQTKMQAKKGIRKPRPTRSTRGTWQLYSRTANNERLWCPASWPCPAGN